MTPAKTGLPDDYYSTNASVFLDIAREAHRAMLGDLNKRIRPKPDGSPGNVIVFDPDRRSFKDAFITIVFCGTYVEAILHILLVRRLGLEKARALDRGTYENKMETLGCADKGLLDAASKYRASRREVVHEKAFLDRDSFKVAQDEAKSAMDFVEKFNAYFGLHHRAAAPHVETEAT